MLWTSPESHRSTLPRLAGGRCHAHPRDAGIFFLDLGLHDVAGVIPGQAGRGCAMPLALRRQSGTFPPGAVNDRLARRFHPGWLSLWSKESWPTGSAPMKLPEGEAVGDVMRTRQGAFGRACFLVGLAALYLLAGMKLYVAWRDRLWPQWPLGDFLPNGVVLGLFSPSAASVRSVLVWLLSRDLVEWAAAACLVLWLLTLPGNGEGDLDDHQEDMSR